MAPPAQYNPLDEPSPLGLRLRKSPSLLELIQMRLSQANSPKGASSSKKELKGAAASGSSEKLKASNFPATILRIGTWEILETCFIGLLMISLILIACLCSNF